MQVDSDTVSWVELSTVKELGPAAFLKLLRAFGSPREILGAGRRQLAHVVPETIAERISGRDGQARAEQALAWLQVEGHWLLTLADESYPASLLQIADPPPVLYGLGDPAMLSRRALSIVGSRNATPQGRENAGQFARALSEAGWTIVSGLALGIDSAAHRAALTGAGSTIAVLGTGADLVYPRSNEGLAREIAAHGALFSEFPLGSAPLAAHFPRRNRLISALAEGCLVVEAAVPSGSLITARAAAEQGRDVFAIPGSIHSPLSRGCHALIKQGAKLVESANDILDELSPGFAFVKSNPEKRNSLDTEVSLLQYIGYDPCNLDSLIRRSGLTPETLSAMLLTLELEGKVAILPGGLYQQIG